jgi:manganese transport protein
MVLIVVLAFAFQTFLAQPNWGEVTIGMFTPHFNGVDSILLATGILGATVMPHAIYLHSSLTQNRIVGRNDAEKRRIFRFEFIDIIIAMVIAGAINMSMLIIAAAVFHTQGVVVEDLDIAYNGLKEALGPMAAVSFGLGLLIAGLASSSVGTLAGDVVMQGFIRKKIPLYLRRAVTMLPPLVIIASGVNATYALVLSQVILSFGIAFALVPLVMFTSKRDIMGSLVNHRITTILGWIVVAIVVTLNIYLLWQTVFG